MAHLLPSRAATAAALAVAALAAAPQAGAATACPRIEDPYAGTRYEGSDLRRIRRSGVGCERARVVVRRAHRKALGLPVPPDGVRRFRWRRWSVVGDVRGATDRYVARKGGARITWVF